MSLGNYLASVWLEPVRDCNNNGEDDQCDLCRYPGWDIQNTGTLDYCECPGDILESGGAPAVDMDDALVLMFNYWGRVDGFGDINTDGVADVQDLLVLLQNWGPCSKSHPVTHLMPSRLQFRIQSICMQLME